MASSTSTLPAETKSAAEPVAAINVELFQLATLIRNKFHEQKKDRKELNIDLINMALSQLNHAVAVEDNSKWRLGKVIRLIQQHNEGVLFTPNNIYDLLLNIRFIKRLQDCFFLLYYQTSNAYFIQKNFDNFIQNAASSDEVYEFLSTTLVAGPRKYLSQERLDLIMLYPDARNNIHYCLDVFRRALIGNGENFDFLYRYVEYNTHIAFTLKTRERPNLRPDVDQAFVRALERQILQQQKHTFCLIKNRPNNSVHRFGTSPLFDLSLFPSIFQYVDEKQKIPSRTKEPSLTIHHEPEDEVNYGFTRIR
jgi:hypothetical protein